MKPKVQYVLVSFEGEEFYMELDAQVTAYDEKFD